METAALLTIAVALVFLALKGTKMSEALDRLTASVAQATTVAESAVTLIGTIAAEIRDNVDDSDALNDLADKLDAETADLAAAVSANTPAAPPVSEPAA